MKKVNEWTSLLSKIAAIEPKFACCAFTAGFKQKVTYSMRVIPDICQHLQNLDRYVEKVFIPALIDEHIPNNRNCCRYLQNLEVWEFLLLLKQNTKNKETLLNFFTKLQLEQTTKYNISREELTKLKINIKTEKSQQRKKERLQSLIIDLSTNKIRLNKINQVKAASTWLWTLLVKEEWYSLLEEEFWDLVKKRYGWPLSCLPNMCSCGAKYNLQHSLSCKKGGFISLWHNHLNSITANLIGQVCHDVQVEPHLETMTGKTFC